MDNLDWRNGLIPLFPKRLAEALSNISGEHAASMEELRIRVGRPMQALGSDWETFFHEAGECERERASLLVQAQDCAHILDAVAFHSVYALEEELRRGCITLPGGYRVGLSGRALLSGGRMERMSSCTFFSFRIARQKKGCATMLMPVLIANGQPVSTLILSPPGCGKTTYLRDIARQLSDGNGECPPQKVCIADERSEIAGCCGGIPQNDVGIRTDVLDGCPKAEAMELMLRALSPQVIITDEVGREPDFYALQEASNAGVILMASAHAGGIMDIRRRPLLRRIHEAAIFDRYIVLGRVHGPGTVMGVYDGALNTIRLPARRQ